jgi:hypothetical protein
MGLRAGQHVWEPALRPTRHPGSRLASRAVAPFRHPSRIARSARRDRVLSRWCRDFRCYGAGWVRRDWFCARRWEAR